MRLTNCWLGCYLVHIACYLGKHTAGGHSVRCQVAWSWKRLREVGMKSESGPDVVFSGSLACRPWASIGDSIQLRPWGAGRRYFGRQRKTDTKHIDSNQGSPKTASLELNVNDDGRAVDASGTPYDGGFSLRQKVDAAVHAPEAGSKVPTVSSDFSGPGYLLSHTKVVELQVTDTWFLRGAPAHWHSLAPCACRRAHPRPPTPTSVIVRLADLARPLALFHFPPSCHI